MVIVAASFSSLSILYTWAFARRAWDDRVAKVAAFSLAIYPEAVLLGSSQMREAFLITLVIAAFYCMLRYFKQHTWQNLVWILLTLLLCIPFSPPISAFLMVLLIMQALAMGDKRIFRQRSFWLILVGLAFLAMAGIWLTWRRFAPPGISHPLALIVWWFKQSISLQARATRLVSGWVQHVFKRIPEWAHHPFILGYGVTRPFLPAAIIDISSAPIWRGIAIWRAVGWTALLPFLVYALIQALRKPVIGREFATSIARGLSIVVWLGIIVAALRGGGDQWDNPRYRAMFAGLQLALAAWVWVEQRRTHDPWLKRTWVSMCLILAWFVPWYLRRYTPLEWPVSDFFKTLGLGVISAVLYILWDWARKPFQHDD